jgi:opacity protein-like surface antigen
MTDSPTPIVRTLALAVLILTLGVAKADAQQQPSLFMEDRAWEVTPFIGVGFGGNLETSPGTGGVAFGYGGRGFGFEGEIARLRGEQGTPTPFDFTTWTFMLNGLYGFEREGFTPYGLFGIGVQRVSADLTAIPGEFDATDSSFAWNVGAGLKTWLTHRAGLRADVRYIGGRGPIGPDFVRLYGGFIWRFGLQ